MTSTQHDTHQEHDHRHGAGCGHVEVRHGDHVDYLHDGHVHREHDGHWDECEPSGQHLVHEGAHDCEHNGDCGHESVQHGDHIDYMHDGHRHAAHDGHWDEH